MVRKLRLISSNSIEVGVTGVDSPFLDSLLTEHPHKVPTISIPFSDIAVVGFAKNVANPGREINRCAARKIVSIYKLLGIDIDVEEPDENATTSVSNTVVGELDVETVEPKYVIKIEFSQQQPSSSSNEVERQSVGERVDLEMINSHEVNDDDVTEEGSESQTSVNNITSSPLLENISEIAGLSTLQLEAGEVVEEDRNSRDDCCSESRKEQTKLHSAISVGDIVIGDVNEDAEFIDTTPNDLVDQPPENGECDSTDEDIDANFSFCDLEEEYCQSAEFQPCHPTNDTIVQETTQNYSEEIGNVISNILNLTYQAHNSSDVLTSSLIAVAKQPLRLEFIRNGLNTIKDITKKRKRKRGQH